MHAGSGLWDAAADLVWGSACVACGRPGRALCGACGGSLRRFPFLARPSSWRSDDPDLYATSDYGGVVRDAVIAHKERSVLALARPLGEALALSVLAVVATAPGLAGEVCLVPMPAAPEVVRRRGHDPLGRITRVATRALRRDGVDARSLAALRLARVVVDQSALDADHRQVNLAGAFAARGRARPAGRVVVVVDDVVTTGATAREAVRALAAADADVVGVAVIAATPLRGGLGLDGSLSAVQTSH